MYSIVSNYSFFGKRIVTEVILRKQKGQNIGQRALRSVFFSPLMACIDMNKPAPNLLMASLLTHSTLYPLLQEIASKPHLLPGELEHLSESLTKRSKMVTNGLLALIGITLSNSSATKLPSEIKVSFLVLMWCILSRMYYEGLPVNELQKLVTNASLQKRVWESNPVLVAALYAIPEIYQILFIAYKVIYGGWVGRDNPHLEYVHTQPPRDEVAESNSYKCTNDRAISLRGQLPGKKLETRSPNRQEFRYK
ncbi:hypothetical protein DL96DRAFT_1564997 [Flagelloscypha sp. PMI_526]|nr:hypothetical protein DL96DRAFT_1564997 [Flagelloscypha sp. PMI_526]